MRKQKYVSALFNADFSKGIWMTIAALMLVTNVLLSIKILTISTAEKTIIVPPVITKPFTMKGSKLDPSYVEQMSNYFIQLLLNYTPQNVTARFSQALKYFHPSLFGKMKAQFSTDEQKIIHHEVSSVFYPMAIHVKHNIAIIDGELVGMIGSKVVSDTTKSYQISYLFESGNFYIDGYKEVYLDKSGKHYTDKKPTAIGVDSDQSDSNDGSN